MIKDRSSQCDYRRHSGDSAEEKIKWNFPRPDRRPNDRLTIVTRLARDRAAGDVHTTSGHYAFCPGFFTQLVNSQFVHTCWEAHASSVLVAAFCGDELRPGPRLF